MAALKAQGELVVVETDDNQYLGFVEECDEKVLVRTGRRGHPVTLWRDVVVSITPAEDHSRVLWR